MAWIPSGYTDSGMEWVADNDPRYLIYSGQMYDPMQSLAVNLNRSYNGMGDGTPESSGGSNVPFAAGPIMTAFRERELAQGNRDLGGYGGQEAYKLIQQLGPNAGLAEVNAILQQSGLRPFSSVEDWQSRNRMLPGNESGSSFGDFLSGSLDHLGDTAHDLWSEPGFRNLALTAAGGAYAGSQYAGANAAAGGAAGAGGTVGAAMPAAIPESAASLANMGLTQTAPGVWSAAAPAGAGIAAGGTGLTAPAYGGGTVTEGGVVGGTSSGGLGTGLGTATAGGTAAATGLGGFLSSPTALGMAGGALLGGLGGSQQAGTVTTEEGLPDWLKAYAKPALDKYSTDLQNYQIDPYGVMPSAMKEFQNTISGMYLDPSTNKYLEDYYKLGAERIKGSLSPSFGHMQAFGQHSGYNESLSRGLGDFATGLYGGNYAKERDRQTQLTAAAPAFLGQSSQAAFQPYSQYLGTIGSLGKKKDEPYFENTFGNILGGALAGGSLGRIWG
jgi:hypothetical protein